MPFTFSHPAIILPLLRKYGKRLSATGLVIGSITPDFESFIKLGKEKMFSHTWSGMFWYDLPLGLLLCILFHTFIKIPLVEHMPAPVAYRFYRFRTDNWVARLPRHFWVVLVSLFIGIFSHLLWDACTHLNFYYPDSDTSTLRIHGIRVYILVQYSCSVIGLLFMAHLVYRLPKGYAPPVQGNWFNYWIIMLLVIILFGCIFTTGLPVDTEINGIMVIYLVIASCLWGLLTVSTAYMMAKVLIRGRRL
jgi:hypothetical protein